MNNKQALGPQDKRLDDLIREALALSQKQVDASMTPEIEKSLNDGFKKSMAAAMQERG